MESDWRIEVGSTRLIVRVEYSTIPTSSTIPMLPMVTHPPTYLPALSFPYLKAGFGFLALKLNLLFPLCANLHTFVSIVEAPAGLAPIAMTVDFASSLPWALYAVQAMLLGIIGIICYRRFFHPLREVPGPFLPAVTRLYLWYYNIIKAGSYYKKIDEMHVKYGTRSHSTIGANSYLAYRRSRRPDCAK
jgi:hypothetical protein